jgi:hypothetical protein
MEQNPTQQKPADMWNAGSYGSYMYSKSGQQSPPEIEEHSSASTSPQQRSAEVVIDEQEDIDHTLQSQAELFVEQFPQPPSLEQISPAMKESPSATQIPAVIAIRQRSNQAVAGLMNSSFTQQQGPPLVAVASVENPSAAPAAQHPGEVVIDMQDITHAASLQSERFAGCAALRQSNQDVEAALTRGNMLMRARKKRAIAVARQTVATGDTSSALIMSTLIAPAMLENVVTLFMDWDSMASPDKIAKITAVAGAVGCIVFAWVRKSMQQKKLNDGASDPSDMSDPMEDINSFAQSISGAVSNAISSARSAVPAPAPSAPISQNSDITSAIQAITNAVSSAITSAHAAAPPAPSAPARK